MYRLLCVAALLCLSMGALTWIGGCSQPEPSPPAVDKGPSEPAATTNTKSVATIELTSSAFEEGQPIPVKHTCDGEDVSPPLAWSGAPEGTKSLALICDDPDAPAGTWVHWVIYNIPADTTELPEGVPTTETLDDGALQGKNDFKKTGYGGPCPPKGKPHRYCFKLYALDAEAELDASATKDELMAAIKDSIIGEGQLVGTYQRR